MVPDEEPRSTTTIHPVSHTIEENGVRLRLNIVDTPGYGDLINNERCWDPIVKYIKDQHSAYLRKELTAQRERYLQDTRIHCCLFFIQPSGHALKPIDIVVLKKLSEFVNVVPVIAKSDSLTLEERAAFKERIKEEFKFHNLRMYPYENEEDDADEVAHKNHINVRQYWTKALEIVADTLQDLIPFAVIGSERTVVVNGQNVRGRQTKWGVINGVYAGCNQKSLADPSQSRTRTTASSSTSATSSHAPTFRTSSRPPPRFTTSPSVLSSCWPSRRALLWAVTPLAPFRHLPTASLAGTVSA